RKLSEGLVREGVEVHVLTRGGRSTQAREERHGVNVHRVPEPAYPRDLDQFVAWVRTMNDHMLAAGRALLAEIEPDLVHGHDWLVGPAATALADAAETPLLVTVHATEHGRHQGWVDKPPQSTIHALERRFARRADQVIVCSHYMRGHVADIFGLSES